MAASSAAVDGHKATGRGEEVNTSVEKPDNLVRVTVVEASSAMDCAFEAVRPSYQLAGLQNRHWDYLA